MVKDKIAQIIQARERLAQQVPDPTLAGCGKTKFLENIPYA
jgi:hypothetical protein